MLLAEIYPYQPLYPWETLMFTEFWLTFFIPDLTMPREVANGARRGHPQSLWSRGTLCLGDTDALRNEPHFESRWASAVLSCQRHDMKANMRSKCEKSPIISMDKQPQNGTYDAIFGMIYYDRNPSPHRGA
jgi:hypothetical protein